MFTYLQDKVNMVHLCKSDNIWLEKGEDIDAKNVVRCRRINIDYAGEWVDKPLRFYVLGNKFISVKDKTVEALMKN